MENSRSTSMEWRARISSTAQFDIQVRTIIRTSTPRWLLSYLSFTPTHPLSQGTVVKRLLSVQGTHTRKLSLWVMCKSCFTVKQGMARNTLIITSYSDSLKLMWIVTKTSEYTKYESHPLRKTKQKHRYRYSTLRTFRSILPFVLTYCI